MAVCVFAAQLAPAAGITVTIGTSTKEKADAGKPVVAVFSLDGPIMERPQGEELPLFAPPPRPSFKEIVERMKKARDDKNVKGVVLLLDEVELGLAQIEELRGTMDSVRAAGKEVYAHVDNVVTMRVLALAAGATRISVTPTAIIMINGIDAESPYLRGLLDKIGVKPDFITCGEYKSATEVFMRKGPSPAAKQMTGWLLDSLYDSFQTLVAKGRGVKPERVRQWVDGGLYSPEQARQLGIIDSVQHRQDFEAELRKEFGDDVQFDHKFKKKGAQTVDLSSPWGLLSLWTNALQEGKKKAAGKNLIGIVYVEGTIVTGKPEPSPFSSEPDDAYSTPLRKALDKLADNKDVKAVVLRVNSPGGSATASEIIFNAAQRVKVKKPVVVSMGSVAASGGYYVSMAGDKIFADAATITASIGVLGGKFATTEMWNNVGISRDSNRRGANAGLFSSEAPFSDSERKLVQTWMNDVYGVFKGHVVAARGAKLQKPIDQLAAGRVYTGRQALELGLVDEIGSLEDAIRDAAKRARLTDYELRSFPEPKNFLELFVEDLADGEHDPNHVSLAAPALGRSGGTSILDLALPHLKGLDPGRLETVKAALRRLDLLGQERAVMMMPELGIRD
jgi:protease-4